MTDTAANKSEFVSEFKFNFKGVNGNLPVMTFEVTKGANAGKRVYCSIPVEKISAKNIGDYWDIETFDDELLHPALQKFALEADKQAVVKATDANGNLDQNVYQDALQGSWTRLTTAQEGIRALKVKLKDLLKELGSLVSQLPAKTEEFMNVGKDIARIQSQLDAQSNAKEDATEPTAVAA